MEYGWAVKKEPLSWRTGCLWNPLPSRPHQTARKAEQRLPYLNKPGLQRAEQHLSLCNAENVEKHLWSSDGLLPQEIPPQSRMVLDKVT